MDRDDGFTCLPSRSTAGGVGITAIAPLHYSLIRGLPVGHASWAFWASQLLQLLRRTGASALGVSGLLAAVSAATLDGAIARRPRTLTTVWSTRDGSLINAFSHMLDPPQPDAGDGAPVLSPSPSPDRGRGAAVAAAAPLSPVREPTPRTNALTKGERLAKSRMWASSFSIHAKRTFGRAEEEAEGCGDAWAPGDAGAPSAGGIHASPSATSLRSMGSEAGGASTWRAAAAGATTVDLRVHLTSGRKRPAAPAAPHAEPASLAGQGKSSVAVGAGASMLPSAPLPPPPARVTSRSLQVGLPPISEADASLGEVGAPDSAPPLPPPSPASRPSPRPRSLNRFASARAMLEAGAAALLHGPAPPEDATVSSASATAAAGSATVTNTVPVDAEALPVVGRLRPDIPRLLEEISENLGGSESVSQLLLRKRRASQTAAIIPGRSVAVFWDFFLVPEDSIVGRLWTLVAFAIRIVVWALCLGGICRKRRASPVTAPRSLPDVSSGVDHLGRTVIAVYVCGPQEMVLSTLEACWAVNEVSAAAGRACVFHVHAETFSF